MSAMAWGAAADFAAQVGTAWLNSDAQRAANKTNIKLQREQQDWEAQMSNTAIQRRAADIEAAGGNRALAFTNGSEATTPTVTPARVDAPQFQAPRINTGLLLAQAQIDNLKAQTYNTSADTRMKNTQASLLEEYGGQSSAQDVVRKTQENAKFEFELKKAIADADISQTNADLLRQQKGQAIDLLTQQARLGHVNADSAEAIAKMLGASGKDVAPLAKLLLEVLKGFAK